MSPLSVDQTGGVSGGASPQGTTASGAKRTFANCQCRASATSRLGQPQDSLLNSRCNTINHAQNRVPFASCRQPCLDDENRDSTFLLPFRPTLAWSPHLRRNGGSCRADCAHHGAGERRGRNRRLPMPPQLEGTPPPAGGSWPKLRQPVRRRPLWPNSNTACPLFGYSRETADIR
jgi:hypothetical protein